MTNTPLPVSCFIIAYNEADRIGVAIDSVRHWVHEVIVVDSGSTDSTCHVAELHGARVVFHRWPGYGPQKRFAEEQCSQDWLLNLDADEEISPELAAEIQRLFTGSQLTHSGYAITIREILPTEKNLPRFSRSVSPVRLYDKNAGRYSESPVHDRVHFIKGTTGALKGPCWHRSSRHLSHSMEKIERYSTMQANDLFARKKGLAWLKLRVALAFPLGFLKAYVLRGYIFKGMPGLVNAVIYGFSRFLRLAKLYERVEISRKEGKQ